MEKKIKRISIISLCAILLLTGLYTYFFVYGFPVSTNSLYIDNISVSDTAIKITGGTVNSSLGFSEYSEELIGTQMLFKPRYSLVSPFNSSGDFLMFSIIKGSTVDEIYIIGKNINDKKRIWLKE